jgi:hypothetical protein
MKKQKGTWQKPPRPQTLPTPPLRLFSKQEPPHCAECGGLDGIIQFTATCRRGRLEAQEAWLHPECEPAYLAKIDPV